MTELDFTRPVLGTMTFGDTVTADTAAQMVDAALAAGITHIDTANGYAGGEAERILADVLRGRRDQVTVATKAGIPHPDADGNAPLSPVGLRASVEGSLRRLDTERVDLFYLHQPDRATPLHETLSTVAQLVEEGKIGALGVSNYAAWQIAEINHLADQVGAPRPVVAQQVYNLLARRIEDEYAEFAAVTGLITMVYNPLGGGLLTGRHSFDADPAEGRFGDSRLAAMYKQRYWNTTVFDALSQLAVLADKAGLPMTELALRWLVSKPVAGPLLLGGSKVSHLENNIAAINAGPLDADLVAECDDIGAALRGTMPNYNR
ncbi:aldo/keto reductase [Mycolicibacterium murale]|uniref:Aldo/keto reductase n=1 Tax=Mycolicibacterium murale TaxID=182220 RepID=A0A7I9WL68_9MYCO|nr:aldo/keto reductase [Mycolicibacterium murale]MCV7185269.1 aldo/keto reductase [Mycolicibacterium murale]GFG58491.1 aldo/keto reductase [Mycolicibacterium murale]